MTDLTLTATEETLFRKLHETTFLPAERLPFASLHPAGRRLYLAQFVMNPRS